jgi:hypothetical protein
MGNTTSKSNATTDEYSTGKRCCFPDTGILHKRMYQTQLISRAIDILDRDIPKAEETNDLIEIQKDVMRYKDKYGVPDAPKTVSVKGKGNVTFYLHDWKILTEDPVFVQGDGQNPFVLFKKPLDDLDDFTSMRNFFRVQRGRFAEARIALVAAMEKDCA